jgi:hypothetical protein
MRRTLSKLGPALFMAAMTLVATAMLAAARHASWSALAGTLILVLALLGTDLVQRRGSGAGSRPSPAALFLAATLLFAGSILSDDRDALAAMLPILGTCAALPFLLRAEGERTTCRRA